MPKGSLQQIFNDSYGEDYCPDGFVWTDEMSEHIVANYQNASFSVADIYKDVTLMKIMGLPYTVSPTDPVPQKTTKEDRLEILKSGGIVPQILDDGYESDTTQAFSDDSDEDDLPMKEYTGFLFDCIPGILKRKILHHVSEQVIYLKHKDEIGNADVISKCIRFTKEQQKEQLLLGWSKKFKWDLKESPFTKAVWEKLYKKERRMKKGTMEYDIWREFYNIVNYVGMRANHNGSSPTQDDKYLRYLPIFRWHFIKGDTDVPNQYWAWKPVSHILTCDKRLKGLNGEIVINKNKEIICVMPKGKNIKKFTKIYVDYTYEEMPGIYK